MSEPTVPTGAGNARSSAAPSHAVKGPNILGLATEELAGLSVEEITGNKVAITMVMHYYKQLVDENASLKNDLNTASTYVMGYQAKKTNTTVGSVLQALATLPIGFGINLITNDPSKAPGWITLVLGIIFLVVGMVFVFAKEKT